MDTSVILDNPKVFEILEECEMVLPFCVLSELDGKRRAGGTVGKNARESIRFIDGLTKNGDLYTGVRTEKGSLVVVKTTDDSNKPNDLKIVDCAFDLQKAGKSVIVLSNDIGLRVQASGVGIEAKGFRNSKQETIYSGILNIEIDKEFIDRLYDQISLELPDSITSTNNFYYNQMIVFKNKEQGSSVLGRVTERLGAFWVEKIIKKNVWGVNPLNSEQTMAIDLLEDGSVELVSLVGKSGCGKTFIALASALHQVFEKKRYKKIILIRPVVSVGKEIGFLPGTIAEKMAPWVQPIKDNLDILCHNRKEQLELWFEKDWISIEPMSFIRGRSIPNSIIIVDECQNISVNQLKTIITRAAKGSKIILTGDIEQIDDPTLDLHSNGLSEVVEKFKNYALSGHVTLEKGQRSDLANLATKIL